MRPLSTNHRLNTTLTMRKQLIKQPEKTKIFKANETVSSVNSCKARYKFFLDSILQDH